MFRENTKYLVHVDRCLLACCNVVRTVRKADADRLINVETASYINDMLSQCRGYTHTFETSFQDDGFIETLLPSSLSLQGPFELSKPTMLDSPPYRLAQKKYLTVTKY